MAAGIYFIGCGHASCEDLQREFGIGYDRASKFIKQLEDEKVISPSCVLGCARKVLMTGMEFIAKYKNL